LIASRIYLPDLGVPVLIVPPDQLGNVPDRCKGVQLMIDKLDIGGSLFTSPEP
jgi:hypothetical protein